MINQFPAFRRYKSAYIAADDAIMALLVSSRLATKYLHAQQDTGMLLPELYRDINSTPA